MRRMLLLLLLVSLWPLAGLLAQPVPAPGAQQSTAHPGDTTWLSVLLDGRKIGSLQIERERTGQTVTTTQTLSLQLNRSGSSIVLGSMARTVESVDGAAQGFAASRSLSSVESTVRGRMLAPGQFEVTTTVGGVPRTTNLQLPSDALMFDGQRRAMLAAGRRPGTRYTLRQFDPASQQILDVRMEVVGDETVSLPEGDMVLSHQRQHMDLSGGPQVMDLWLDDQGIARKGRLSLVGMPLEMVSCSRECATAPSQSADMFHAAIVFSPRFLPANLRRDPLVYRVHTRNDLVLPFARTGEQQVSALGHGNWQVVVGRPQAHRQMPPTEADVQATDWLQSDEPRIRMLAAQAVGSARKARDKMRRLRSFVTSYITNHGLDIGYASALEVVNTREGDCTEYAVLLAALARAQGIPARVVTGMVYADRYDGGLRVFVPHAWTQAWVQGRWESYDAALKQFDSGHIALATGDGDPRHFFGASRMFGEMRMDQVQPLSELISIPTSGAAPPSAAGRAGK